MSGSGKDKNGGLFGYSKDSYTDFLWAKKKEENGLFNWLPLKQHLIDTTGVINQLWNRWLSDNQKDIIRTSLSKLHQNNDDRCKSFPHVRG